MDWRCAVTGRGGDLQELHGAEQGLSARGRPRKGARDKTSGKAGHQLQGQRQPLQRQPLQRSGQGRHRLRQALNGLTCASRWPPARRPGTRIRQRSRRPAAASWARARNASRASGGIAARMFASGPASADVRAHHSSNEPARSGVGSSSTDHVGQPGVGQQAAQPVGIVERERPGNARRRHRPAELGAHARRAPRRATGCARAAPTRRGRRARRAAARAGSRARRARDRAANISPSRHSTTS